VVVLLDDVVDVGVVDKKMNAEGTLSKWRESSPLTKKLLPFGHRR
jgi:hypothetical protein